MPIYEYECRKCGAVSEYLEKREAWHLFPRKCRQCGRRRTRKIVSSFSSTVERSRAESLNELRQMGNVRFVPQHAPPWGQGPPPGGCPYEKGGKEESEDARPAKEGPIELKSG